MLEPLLLRVVQFVVIFNKGFGPPSTNDYTAAKQVPLAAAPPIASTVLGE